MSKQSYQDAEDKQRTQYQLTPRSKPVVNKKFPKSECTDFSIRPLKHKWPKSWSSVEDPVVPLERTLYGHPLAGTLWDRLWKYGWEESPGWECFFVAEKKDYSCLCMWTVFNWLGRNKSLTQCGKNLWKKSIWESQHHSLTMFIWVALNEHAKRAKILWKITETCLNPESLLGLSKRQLCSGKLVANISSWSFDTESHAKKCAERYIASWRTKQLNSYTKSQHHALMTERNCELKKQINSTIASKWPLHALTTKKKNWNL